MVNLNDIQDLVFEEYIKNGYAERWTKEYLIAHPDELDLIIDLAEVGLIGTEVAELQEDIRNAANENYGKECADIIIRVLNWANRKGFAVEPHLLEKHQINLTREKLHGRKI